MTGFGKLLLVQTKLYFREPMSAFFTLAFGPLLLILLGFIFGNTPDPMLNGQGYLERSMPAYMAVIVSIVGLTAVPIASATRWEKGGAPPRPLR